MPTTSEPRHRLDVLMDERRGELRLRWRDVAVLAGISYEAIRAIRKGGGDIRMLTQRGLEDALQWEPGSIRSVLDGGDPVPRAVRAITEYGLLMSGGGFRLRRDNPEVERIYPTVEWAAAEIRLGGHVYRRRVVVVEDWVEL